MTESPVGVVLAGGRSRRLGIDKTRLTLVREGVSMTLIEWAIRRLEPLCTQLLLAGPDEAIGGGMRNPGGERIGAGRLDTGLLDPGRPRPGGGLGETAIASVADGPAPGPAGGLLGAARAAPDRHLLVLACDLPWLPATALESLAAAGRSTDVALYRGLGGLEPLCARWSPRALARLAERCASGDPSLWATIESPGLAAEILNAETLPPDAFFNLNRPTDLEVFRAREGARG